MAELSRQRTRIVTESAPDITGFDVQPRDGKIGTIDAATHEIGPHHIVVETDFSISEPIGSFRAAP
jgi:hypothetical protein